MQSLAFMPVQHLMHFIALLYEMDGIVSHLPCFKNASLISCSADVCAVAAVI